MQSYHIEFSIDGSRTFESVAAQSESAAKKIIIARYAGHKITFWRCVRE